MGAPPPLPPSFMSGAPLPPPPMGGYPAVPPPPRPPTPPRTVKRVYNQLREMDAEFAEGVLRKVRSK